MSIHYNKFQSLLLELGYYPFHASDGGLNPGLMEKSSYESHQFFNLAAISPEN